MERNRFDLCRQTTKARLLFPTTSRFEAVFQHFNYFLKQAAKPTSTRKRHQVCVDYTTDPGFDNRVKQTQRHGRTDAFKWPSRGEEGRCLHVPPLPLLRHFLKCLPNLSPREQPVLLALDVFSVGRVIRRPSQGAETKMRPKTTHDPTYSRWTPSGSLKRSPSLSS